MIDVLSDEIYRGDRYVFLRELLQNSIDAIRLRRALHDSKNTGVTFDGAIHVKVEHQTEGRATVSWTDNGCGMSVFIVRNYLTVAGRSFYRSEDFQKLGVKMDPISRFGVGILSCFMVAERLEIVTRQDPQIESGAEALKVEIHNPKRHLRIQRYAPDALPSVGTTVKVFVGSLASNDAVPVKLDVTGYLGEVAGFVEFPIYVEEDGRRTVILHPDRVASCGKTTGWEVVSLDCSFAWQDFFVPQDARRARDFFTEERITIKPSANNPLFEGIVSLPVLNDDIELRRNWGGFSRDEEEYTAICGTKEVGTIRIRYRSPYKQRRSGKSRSSDCDNMCRIYCDGVLVAGASSPGWAGVGWSNPSTFRLALNIRRTAETMLDLSRHDIADGEHNWSEFVLQQYVDSFRKRVKQIVAAESPKEALYRLARLFSYRAYIHKSLGDLVGDTAIPLLVLKKTGDVAVVRSTALPTGIVNVVPKSLAESLALTFFEDWASKKWFQSKTTRIPWSGGSCVFANYTISLMGLEQLNSLVAVGSLHNDWLVASYDLRGVRFLSPGKEKEPPLIQEMWLPKKFHNRKGKECDQSSESVKTALKANTDLAKIHHEFAGNAPKFVEFAVPFERFFTAGWRYLNVLHPAVKALSECIKAIADKQSATAISEHDLGTICDALQPLFGERSRGLRMNDYLSGSEIEEKCEEIRRLFDLTSQLEIFEMSADLPWARESVNVPSVVEAGRLGAPIRSLREVGLR